ncbi:MAG: hypothetical protein K2O99_04360 [Lachnospiraceae bacterium]|nr:hypothetical protein [Lachnospiraceae bacterium]
MKCNAYITVNEHEKCRRIAAVFAEFKREDDGIIITDAGKYGFVRLSYYNEAYGFGKSVCYTDSHTLFNALWQDWLNEQLFQIALQKQSLMNMNYTDILQSLPEETRSALIARRQYFAEKAGI